MSGDTVSNQIRKVLMRIAERIEKRTQNGDNNGVAGYIFRIIVEEFKAEALGKKPKDATKDDK